MSLNPSIVAQLGISEEDLASYLTSDIRKVFSSMVEMDDLLHLPQVAEPFSHFSDCVTAMVDLTGAINGKVSLYTTENLALAITTNMLGMEVTEIDADVFDALGEIANMIGGSFKHHLSDGGDDIKLSPPTVVQGTDEISSGGGPADALSLVFDVESEWFLVSVTLD